MREVTLIWVDDHRDAAARTRSVSVRRGGAVTIGSLSAKACSRTQFPNSQQTFEITFLRWVGLRSPERASMAAKTSSTSGSWINTARTDSYCFVHRPATAGVIQAPSSMTGDCSHKRYSMTGSRVSDIAHALFM